MGNLLFISLSGRVIKDKDGNLYLNSHMNSKIIARYQKICDNLTLLLRDNCQVVSKSEALKNFNEVPKNVNVIPCANPYKPIFNIINPFVIKEIKNTIEQNIVLADKVIIAQATGIYANVAIDICKKYKKKYLLIVGGFSYECDWYNGLKGKLVAQYRENKCKKNILGTDYVLYVTNKALQDRYPTKGKSLGCSDVEIYELNKENLKKRTQRYTKGNNTIVIGTMAQLDVKLKGVKYVIEALSLLKKKGYANFKYQIVGNGDANYLLNIVERLDLKNEVDILGSLPHDEIYKWLETVDIYIQPSFTEGLSRAILEAMSAGCPVLCTNVGGNVELGSKNYMFKPGHAEEIASLILNASQTNNLIKLSEYSYEVASKYIDIDLNKKRNNFFEEFMKS